MPEKLSWADSEEIAMRLHAERPELDPLSVRFTDLRQWVCDLPEFVDGPETSTEGKLEAIQMAWLEEYRAGQR